MYGAFAKRYFCIHHLSFSAEVSSQEYSVCVRALFTSSICHDTFAPGNDR